MFLEDKLFRVIVWAAIGLTVCDAIWFFIDGIQRTEAACISYVSNIVYFLLTGGITYLCVLYVEYRFHEERWRTAKKDQKRYLKGEYRTLAVFSFLPVMSGIAQVLFPGFPLLCVGTVITVLMIFINLQNQQICKDALSGVNNRRHLNRYLDARIACRHRRRKLFFILMDIDSFKQINDTYGHITGDNAIIHLASILKEVCCVNNDFVARYGGDEFAIICEREDCQEVEKLILEIQNILEFFNEENDAPYKIEISVGYAEYGEENMENQDQLIALADQRLYEVKRIRKSRVVTEH